MLYPKDLYLSKIGIKCNFFLISFYLIIKEEKVQAMLLCLRSLVDVQIRDLQRTSPSEWKGLLLFSQI